MDFLPTWIDRELKDAHMLCNSTEGVVKGPGRQELQDWYANHDLRITTPLPAAGE